MINAARLFTLGLAATAAFAAPATAAPTASGATIDDVQTALTEKFSVKRASSDKGKPFLIVTGKTETIAVHMVHCGGEATCEGVRYFAVLDTKPTAAFMNAYNLEFYYTKLAVDGDGDGILSVENLILGGVSDSNLQYNAAALMVGIRDYRETLNNKVAAAPATGTTKTLSAALNDHAFAGAKTGPAVLSLEPALLGKLKAGVRAD
jgi:hypothetical protein